MPRTAEENYNLIISALRANRLCIKQRQTLNLIRSTVSGQVEPSIGKNAAIDLINCFNRVNDPAAFVQERKTALQFLMEGRDSSEAINAYVDAQ